MELKIIHPGGVEYCAGLHVMRLTGKAPVLPMAGERSGQGGWARWAA